MENTKPKRRRILVSQGVLVSSTNAKQYACIRELTIIHYYRTRNYKRIRRETLST